MSAQVFVPRPTDATGPYWDATRDHKLVLQYCPRCEEFVHHPREACPGCLGREFRWVESTGRGTVHAFSVHHRPFEAMSADDLPYIVAFIDLEEGVRFLSNIIGVDPAAVAVGHRVNLTWRAVGEGYHLPVFEPADR